MQVAVRPYLTSGVALVGASVIAVTPIAVTPPDVHLPEISVSSAAVKLTAAADPISAYMALIQSTVENVSALGGQFLANPAPILTQVIANQIANGGNVLAALTGFGNTYLQNVLTMVPAEFQSAIDNLAAGNVAAVGQNLVNVIVQPALFPALSLLPALQTALQQPLENLLAVTEQFVTIAALGGIGALSPLASAINAPAQAIQNVLDAAGAFDPVGVAGAIAAAPAVVLNGILNGFGADGGLISPGLGLINALRTIVETIATAITPAAATVAAPQELAAVASATTAATATVTLDVAPPAGAQDSAAADTGTEAKTSAATKPSGEAGDTDAKAISSGANEEAEVAKGADAAAGTDTSAVDGSKDGGATGTDATTGTEATTGTDATKDADATGGDADAKGDAKTGADKSSSDNKSGGEKSGDTK